jgi:hypothetical protein
MTSWKSAPDPDWIDFLKLAIGLMMFLSLVVLAAIIGIGDVRQENSFGLQDVLGGLLVAFGAWGQWAFTKWSRAAARKHRSKRTTERKTP